MRNAPRKTPAKAGRKQKVSKSTNLWSWDEGTKTLVPTPTVPQHVANRLCVAMTAGDMLQVNRILSALDTLGYTVITIGDAS